MSDEAVKPRRRYDNRGRTKQAQATRGRVLAAARSVLTARGYAGTTMAAVAREAGVSVETIYKGFGSKRALVSQLLGVALVGDDEPVTLAQRPEARAVAAQADGAEMLRRYAGLVRELYDRLGTLPAILLVSARSGQTELEEFAAEMSSKRLADASMTLGQFAATGQLRADLAPDHARDLLWAFNSPELHHLLTVERGWSSQLYEQWLARTLIAALCVPPSCQDRLAT